MRRRGTCTPMVARSNRFRFGRARRLRLTPGPDGERCILVASTTYAVFVSGNSSPVGFEPRETVRLYAPGCRRVRRQMVGADELPARKRPRSRPATAHGSADKTPAIRCRTSRPNAWARTQCRTQQRASRDTVSATATAPRLGDTAHPSIGAARLLAALRGHVCVRRCRTDRATELRHRITQKDAAGAAQNGI